MTKLSKFEEMVVHLSNNEIVNFTYERAKSHAEKQAACALKLFLNEAVKSGHVVQFIRDHELEERVQR